MMNQVIGLFNGQTQTPAILLAVAAFVIGMVAMCLLCKIFCPCGKQKTCEAKKPQQPRKDEPRPVKRHPAPEDGSIEIYVGNLSYDLTEDQLRTAFEAYGKVNSARIITNRYNNKSKGFGFVHMPNKAEVNAAIAALSEKEILGRALKCNVAKNVA